MCLHPTKSNHGAIPAPFKHNLPLLSPLFQHEECVNFDTVGDCGTEKGNSLPTHGNLFQSELSPFVYGVLCVKGIGIISVLYPLTGRG